MSENEPYRVSAKRRVDPLDHCPTLNVCPSCREGWGHWDGTGYVPTLESEAAPNG